MGFVEKIQINNEGDFFKKLKKKILVGLNFEESTIPKEGNDGFADFKNNFLEEIKKAQKSSDNSAFIKIRAEDIFNKLFP